ncbi:MAG: hypothetical protein P4L33_03615 [Capsulimonadaceae bacterium]|nr:hypothetical protein [Capsulimonadaceae bacterium]
MPLSSRLGAKIPAAVYGDTRHFNWPAPNLYEFFTGPSAIFAGALCHLAYSLIARPGNTRIAFGRQRTTMQDFLFVLLTIVFFVVAGLYTMACHKL